ncbi:unnamed protein product [Diabrotica balteata]|uniref:Transforming acidic coiled-coil-containing protein C-terminal domain-containing protein n=1 Tax=Diabrotica balteata TaxID=107213 RepID=A0A9N9SQD7_DIABA|nr:unnamed protein product [Diabrotica balteata]
MTETFEIYEAEPSHKMDTKNKLDAVSNEALTSPKKTDENSDTNSEDQHSENIKFFDVQNETFENGEFKSLENIVEEQNQTTDSGRHSLDFDLQIGEPVHIKVSTYPKPLLWNEYTSLEVNKENSVEDPSTLHINNKNSELDDSFEILNPVKSDSSEDSSQSSTDSNRASIDSQSSDDNTNAGHQNLNNSDNLVKFENIASLASEDSSSAGDTDCANKYKNLLSLLNEYRQSTDSTRKVLTNLVSPGKKLPYDNLDIELQNQADSDININYKNQLHLNGNGLSTESSGPNNKIDVEFHDETESDVTVKYNYLLSLLNIDSAYFSSDYIDIVVIYKQLISLLNLNETLHCSAGTDYSTRYKNLLSLVNEHRCATESLITSTIKKSTGDNIDAEYLNSNDIKSSPNGFAETNKIVKNIKEKDIVLSEEVIKAEIGEDINIGQATEKNKRIKVSVFSGKIQAVEYLSSSDIESSSNESSSNESEEDNKFRGENLGAEYLSSSDIESSSNKSEEVIKAEIGEDINIVQTTEKNKRIKVSGFTGANLDAEYPDSDDIEISPNRNEVQGETSVFEKPSETVNENNCLSKDLSQKEPSDILNKCVKLDNILIKDRSAIEGDTTRTEIISVKSEEGSEPVEGNSLKVPEISGAKFLEISVHNSSNELDKTTSCLEDDVCLNNSTLSPNNSSDAPEELINGIPAVPVKTDSDNLDGTFVADSNCSTSSEALNCTKNSRQSSPVKGDTEILNKSFSVDTNSNLPNNISSDAVKDLINSNTEIIGSTSESKENAFFTPSVDTFFSPIFVSCLSFSFLCFLSRYTLLMTDMVDKLNQQQAEISDLKLKLNAAQQHNASLELQIRQNEEIVIKTQAEALRTEQNYQQEVKQLKQKLNENSKIIEKDRIKELEEQLKDAKAKEAKLTVEISQKTKEDLNFQKIMDQYELTLKSRISETKRLQEESETTRTHLTNLEIAFSDVHSKYEKTKAALQRVKANEEALLADLELAQSTNIQHEERYESLKAHARTQIEKSNKEIHDVKEQHDIEINKLRAFIRRLEIKVSSLEISLQQKTEECEQLSALCDEVTGKNV